MQVGQKLKTLGIVMIQWNRPRQFVECLKKHTEDSRVKFVDFAKIHGLKLMALDKAIMETNNLISDFTPYKPIEVHKQKRHTTCPALDHETGKCYGKAYFLGKPGKCSECDPGNCEYGFEANKEN